jgi:hypothetical protein
MLLPACGQQADNNSTNTTPAGSTASAMDLNRSNPKTEAVQQYQEKVDNPLNDWFFKVKLFETEKRFIYKMTLQHEEVIGEDEITFPNLGMDPQPVIKKGTAKYECIIGFLDQQGAFREYKKVHVLDGNLKITTLKSYAITVK